MEGRLIFEVFDWDLQGEVWDIQGLLDDKVVLYFPDVRLMLQILVGQDSLAVGKSVVLFQGVENRFKEVEPSIFVFLLNFVLKEVT